MSINEQNKQTEEENKPAAPEPAGVSKEVKSSEKTKSSEEVKSSEAEKPKGQFYTVKELGKLIFKNTNTLRQEIRKGDIKAVKMGGRGWRISPAEVERLKTVGYPTPGLHLSKTAKPSGSTIITSQKERGKTVEPMKTEKPKEAGKEAKPWYSIGGLDW